MSDDSPASAENNVVQLFFDETALEEAWQRFDLAMRVLHALYDNPDETNELERRTAAVEAAAAEVDFRRVFARTGSARLLKAAG